MWKNLEFNKAIFVKPDTDIKYPNKIYSLLSI